MKVAHSPRFGLAYLFRGQAASNFRSLDSTKQVMMVGEAFKPDDVYHFEEDPALKQLSGATVVVTGDDSRILEHRVHDEPTSHLDKRYVFSQQPRPTIPELRRMFFERACMEADKIERLIDFGPTDYQTRENRLFGEAPVVSGDLITLNSKTKGALDTNA